MPIILNEICTMNYKHQASYGARVSIVPAGWPNG